MTDQLTITASPHHREWSPVRAALGPAYNAGAGAWSLYGNNTAKYFTPTAAHQTAPVTILCCSLSYLQRPEEKRIKNRMHANIAIDLANVEFDTTLTNPNQSSS